MGSPFNVLMTIKLKLQLVIDFRFRLSSKCDPRSRAEYFIQQSEPKIVLQEIFLKHSSGTY